MTTILATFFFSLAISLMTTPLLGIIGKRIGAVDMPDARKVHVEPIPRTGGVAIFISFLAALVLVRTFHTDVANALVIDYRLGLYTLGGCIVFGVGLVDDMYRIRAAVKLAFQIIGATLAFLGGVAIGKVNLIFFMFDTGPFSYFVTVFWFILFINAVNLIDGLDGLAGGVSLFASMMMIGLLIMEERYEAAMMFAALGGALLGFLRYNFNPASIFMGDSGSYFIGYLLGGLSIMGSAKTQMGTLMLIPMLALGVPIFDTVLSPMRRFITGRHMFQPDKEHVHHKLLQFGLTTRKAVMIIYAISFGLCIIALLLVNLQNETAGLFLSVLGAVSFVFVRKLGYLEYFAMDKLYGWFRDITDEAGITLERRSFLNLQMEIARSENVEELWKSIEKTLARLKFDMGEMKLNPPKTEAKPEYAPKKWRWIRPELRGKIDIFGPSVLKLEMPLIDSDCRVLGTLWLLKDLGCEAVHHHTFRRVEHLRRTVIRTIEQIRKENLLVGQHATTENLSNADKSS